MRMVSHAQWSVTHPLSFYLMLKFCLSNVQVHCDGNRTFAIILDNLLFLYKHNVSCYLLKETDHLLL